MTSTAVRSTPNLTVPTTQNTAPVLEFRCLYTHDVRRKSKRWQDGFLCFHTFNKRVMVYDVPRNFIGDMHWRSGGTVQDGDELELEKGVLVQVGEGVGRMEQDLTGLFEKRRAANESPQAKKTTGIPSPCSSSGNNTSATFTQLRPKSLNALLGTPRGRYGRAMLPNVSPFEERHQANKPILSEEGRSVKRQKLNLLPLTTKPPHSPSLPRARPTPSDRRPIPAPTPKPAMPTVPRQEHQQPDIIEIDSADETPSKPRNNPIQPPLIPRAKRPSANQTRPASPLFCPSSPPVSTSNHLPPTNPVPNNPPPPTSPSAAKEPPESDPSVSVNPLRPAARKPRKKLMYKDLLPPKRPPSPPSDNSDAPIRIPAEPDTRLATRALFPPRPAAAVPLAPPAADDHPLQPTTALPRKAAPRTPHPVAPSASRPVVPLRRCDSAPTTSAVLPPPSRARPDSPVAAARSIAVRAAGNANAKGPLRKCASLPVPLGARRSDVVMGRGGGGCAGGGNGGTRAEEDIGPWSREAADLLAWRPPSVASASASASAAASVSAEMA